MKPLTVYMEGSPLQADISRYVTMKATSVTYLFDAPRGFFKVLSLEVFDYVDCKELNDPYFNDLLSKIDDRNRFKNILKCPDFKGNSSKSEVLSNNKNILYKYIWIHVYPCSRQDPSECVSAGDISQLRVIVTNTNKTIDPSNSTHPYKTTITTQEMPINPSKNRLVQYLTKKTKISDIRNNFFGPEQKGEFLTADLVFDDTDLRPPTVTYCKPDQRLVLLCPAYIGLEFEGGAEVIQVERKYNLPTEIIGEVGGVLKVALMFGMVYTIYNKAKKKSFIIESVFSQQKNSKKNQVRERRFVQTREGSQSAERSGMPRRGIPSGGQPTRQSKTEKYTQKAKEECFKSNTGLTELIKNMNCLELIERLGVNEHSKKLLQQALFIKRLIEQSPILSERFEALKKKKS